MKKNIIIFVTTLLVVSCSQGTNVDIINSQLNKISDGRYKLENASCFADYYVNGDYYFDVPKIGRGFYVYYENNKNSFPAFDFIDNREGVLQVKGLPIKNIRSILYADNVFFVKSEKSVYTVSLSDDGVPIVKKSENTELSSEDINKEIKFSRVDWEKEFLHNYKNTFLSVADKNIENYKEGATPRVVCIKNIALFSLYKTINDKKVKVNYLAGETAYANFILRINDGEVVYVNHDDFIKKLIDAHKYGSVYFVNSIDFYLREKYLMGLDYKKYYNILR